MSQKLVTLQVDLPVSSLGLAMQCRMDEKTLCLAIIHSSLGIDYYFLDYLKAYLHLSSSALIMLSN
jgi:hypothetical protein